MDDVPDNHPVPTDPPDKPYPEQARDIARPCVTLTIDGTYEAPEGPLLAMLDGDDKTDTRLYTWWNSDPQTRRDSYLQLDKAYGINEKYVNRKVEFPHTARFPEPESVTEKAKIRVYYGIFDVMGKLVEHTAETEFKN